MKITLAHAIQSLCPGSEFSYTEEDYSTIQWDVLEGEPPTQKEIDAEIARLTELQTNEAQAKAEARAAILERLGLTEDEAKLILG